MSQSDELSQTIQLMRQHTSVRQYKDEPIEQEVLHKIIQAAQHAASSNFVQAYSIIQITDKKMRERLASLANNQTQIVSAPVFLLFVADLKRLEYACSKQGVKIEHDTLENFIVSTVDVALLAQNVALAAESLGYGICYIGGVRNNPNEISELTGLPDKTFPVFGMTIGVPAEKQWVKPRLRVEAVLHENQYDEQKSSDMTDEFDNTLSEYYEKRLSNNKVSNWSQSMATFLSEPNRTHMKSFLSKKGFHLN